MIIKIYGKEIPCTKVIRGEDWIDIWDGESLIRQDSGITDFSGYILDGGVYGAPPPTAEETLSSKINYLAMMGGVELW